MNSISGVRALACASRTCRALASPYFFKPVKCEFKELIPINLLESPPVVTLSTADNFKTLKFHGEPYPGRDRLKTITQVLSVDNTYECFEYRPGRSSFHFNLSAPALDLLSRTLPFLSRLVIDLGGFNGYSTSWDQAYKKATEKNTRYSNGPFSLMDGLDIVCAIARFENLRHLSLHFELQRDQIALMHPTPGCEAVLEVFEFIQRRKRDKVLLRLDVTFYTTSVTIFGCGYRTWCTDLPTVSNTMTVVCNNGTSVQDGKQPRCRCTCDNPHYGKVIERRKRTERLYGKRGWTCRLGSVQRKLLQGRYRALPWSIVMESVMWLALLPSNFVFEKGKRVRYEPSLANLEISDGKYYSRERPRFRERFFEMILPY